MGEQRDVRHAMRVKTSLRQENFSSFLAPAYRRHQRLYHLVTPYHQSVFPDDVTG